MRKAIFIILTLAGFASGAEMEVTDRLSVDGSSLFKSTGIGDATQYLNNLLFLGGPSDIVARLKVQDSRFFRVADVRG